MAHKSLLSKNLLGMKFMQRTKEKIDVEEEVKATFGYEGDVDILNGEGKPPVEIWPTESSYGPCEDLRFGHMSFGGYNVEIEALMAEKLPKTSSDIKSNDKTFDGMTVDTVEEASGDTGRGKKRKRNRYLRPVD